MSLSCSLPLFLKWLVTCTCFAQQILMKLEKCTIHQVVEREHFKSATRKGGMEAKLLEIIEVGVAVMNCAFYSCLIRIFLCQAFFSENPCEERRENCSSKLHNWGEGATSKGNVKNVCHQALYTISSACRVSRRIVALKELLPPTQTVDASNETNAWNKFRKIIIRGLELIFN